MRQRRANRWSNVHGRSAVAVDETPRACRLARARAAGGAPGAAHATRRGSVNGLLETHHYLGYTQPVGEHLKYLVYAQGRPVACFAWTSAPRHLGPRDRFIGWRPTVRRRNIRLVAYNTRFLIMPWVSVPHLASHLLGRMARHALGRLATPVWASGLLRGDLRRPGAVSWHLLPAANWIDGDDHGARQGRPDQQAEPLEEAGAGLPLVKDFRQRLSRVP